MKSPACLIPIVSLIASAISAQAVTHAVLPGASIQAKIDIAIDGDIVAIFGGTYNEDITIDKAIRLVEVSGQEVTLTGNVTFSGVSDCPPFDGFTVGSSGRGITVTNTTGMVLRNLAGATSSGISINGTSDVKVLNCQTTNISTSGTTSLLLLDTQATSLTAGGSKTEVAKTSFTGAINHTAGTLNVASVTVGGNFETQSAALKTVGFRTNVSGDCNWRSKKSWFGYGKARSFNFYGTGCKVVFTASEIDRLGLWEVGMNLEGSNNKYIISNSYIHNVTQYEDYWNQHNAIELQGANHHVVIQNNYFKLNRHLWNYSDGLDIFDSTNVIIQNNIMDGSDWFASAPFGVVIRNNHVVNGQDYARVRDVLQQKPSHLEIQCLLTEAPTSLPKAPPASTLARRIPATTTATAPATPSDLRAARGSIPMAGPPKTRW